MTYLPSCHLYFHTNGDMHQLAKLHRLLSWLPKWFKAKQNQTTWSVMKSLLPGYELICIFPIWYMSFEHIWRFSWFDRAKCWFFFLPWLSWDVSGALCSVLPFSGRAHNGLSALSLKDQGWHCCKRLACSSSLGT